MKYTNTDGNTRIIPDKGQRVAYISDPLIIEKAITIGNSLVAKIGGQIQDLSKLKYAEGTIQTRYEVTLDGKRIWLFQVKFDDAEVNKILYTDKQLLQESEIVVVS